MHNQRVYFAVPTNCPCCNAATRRNGAYLECTGTKCHDRIVGSVKNWIDKTGIKNWGDSLVDALVRSGLVGSLVDLYLLVPSDLMDLTEGRSIGPDFANKLIAERDARSEMPLNVLLGSLGVPMWSRSMFAVLIDAGFNSIEAITHAIETYRLETIRGVGPDRAEALRAAWDEVTRVASTLLSRGVTLPAAPVRSGTSLEGVSFVFTGFRDTSLEDAIRSCGGTIRSGVAKGVTYLVAKDPSSGSSKLDKARKLGVEVINRSEAGSLAGI